VPTAEDALIGDLGDAVQRDPEVRQARMIAAAARSRLLACVTDPQNVIDLAEAQRMLDALRNAQAHAEDAEDRVLLHRGLLTPAEADRRAACRRPASRRPGGPERAGQVVRFDPGSRLRIPALTRRTLTRETGIRETGTRETVALKNVLRVIAAAVAPVAVGVACVVLARRFDVRLPRVRR
jgi:hypothetical protein